MIRAVIELLVTIIVMMVARAIFSSVFKNLSSAAAPRTRNQSAAAPKLQGSELHKDPVCGTYVPESARFQRQVGRETFYYCSEACSRRHEARA